MVIEILIVIVLVLALEVMVMVVTHVVKHWITLLLVVGSKHDYCFKARSIERREKSIYLLLQQFRADLSLTTLLERGRSSLLVLSLLL